MIVSGKIYARLFFYFYNMHVRFHRLIIRLLRHNFSNRVIDGFLTETYLRPCQTSITPMIQ